MFEPDSKLPALTPREQQILHFTRLGHTQARVAELIGVSVRRVATVTSGLRAKTGLRCLRAIHDAYRLPGDDFGQVYTLTTTPDSGTNHHDPAGTSPYCGVFDVLDEESHV